MAENYRRPPPVTPGSTRGPASSATVEPEARRLTDRTPAQAGGQRQPDRSVAHVTLDPRLRGDVALHSVPIVIPAKAGIHRRNVGASIPNASANGLPPPRE